MTIFHADIKTILESRLQRLPVIVCESSLACDIDELVAGVVPRMRLAIVSDKNTAEAYGDSVTRALKSRFDVSHVVLARGVVADDKALLEVEQKTSKVDVLVAVGSGTINDLCKYASFKAGNPYILFPTAASMNGYVSANASISINGHKQSFAAHLPLAVFADMGLIAAAPVRLSQAGLGDALARPTAQADWLLSHYLIGTSYDDAPFLLTANYEAELFDAARGVLTRDKATIATLFKTCLLSGFGMTIAGSSAPASGAEHMIAHLMNSSGHLHGEEIALTTLTCAKIQEKLLGSKKVEFLPTINVPDDYKKAYAKKRKLIEATGWSNDCWQAAREAVSAIHIPTRKLAEIVAKAGLPDRVEKLDWVQEEYDNMIAMARFTRDRFTCLDLVIP